MPDVLEAVFQRTTEFWKKKASRGPAYVGRIGESEALQRARIELLLQETLPKDFYASNAMDFGCGPGRFIPTLSRYAGHIWAVDILEEQLSHAKIAAENVTVMPLTWPIEFKWKKPRIDFLWVSLVLQHITDELLFRATTGEIARVLKPGARIIILDNARDTAPHVKPRSAKEIMEALGAASDFSSKLVTINTRPEDHWLIDGHKA